MESKNNTARDARLLDQLCDVIRVNRDNIEGTTLNNRFVVGKPIDKGSFGNVYDVYDNENKNIPMVIKFSPDYVILYKEIRSIKSISKKIWESPQQKRQFRKQVPIIYSHGLIIFTDEIMKTTSENGSSTIEIPGSSKFMEE